MATMVRRRGENASPAAREYADRVFARLPVAFNRDEWNIDCAAKIAAYRAPVVETVAAPAARRRGKRA